MCTWAGDEGIQFYVYLQHIYTTMCSAVAQNIFRAITQETFSLECKAWLFKHTVLRSVNYRPGSQEADLKPYVLLKHLQGHFSANKDHWIRSYFLEYECWSGFLTLSGLDFS